MRIFYAALALPPVCMVAHAELPDTEEVAALWALNVAEVQQAIREYDLMYFSVQDVDGTELKRVVPDAAMCAEVAQMLVPLQVAQKFTDDEEYPRVVLVMISVDGKKTELILTDIHASGEDAYNCTLPAAEYGRLQWLLMEMTEE